MKYKKAADVYNICHHSGRRTHYEQRGPLCVQQWMSYKSATVAAAVYCVFYTPGKKAKPSQKLFTMCSLLAKVSLLLNCYN